MSLIKNIFILPQKTRPSTSYSTDPLWTSSVFPPTTRTCLAPVGLWFQCEPGIVSSCQGLGIHCPGHVSASQELLVNHPAVHAPKPGSTSSRDRPTAGPSEPMKTPLTHRLIHASLQCLRTPGCQTCTPVRWVCGGKSGPYLCKMIFVVTQRTFSEPHQPTRPAACNQPQLGPPRGAIRRYHTQVTLEVLMGCYWPVELFINSSLTECHW